MSILSDVEKKLGIIENDVVHFFAVTLPADEKIIAADIEAIAGKLDTALEWMGAHGQEIATDVLGLVGIAGTIAASLGTGIPAPVLAAAAGLNAAVSLVNKALAAKQAAAAGGASNLSQAIAAGGAAYVALKGAQVDTAKAQATVAKPST